MDKDDEGQRGLDPAPASPSPLSRQNPAPGLGGSPRSPPGSDGRLRARLEASAVGLDELSLLRQNHLRAVQSVKAMLMANVPPEEPAGAPGKKSPGDGDPGAGGEVPEGGGARSREQNGQEEQQEGTVEAQQSNGGCRKRASSMDIAVARSLALTAKKLAKTTQYPPGAPCDRYNGQAQKDINQFPEQTSAMRCRASSFSTEKHASKVQMRKGQSMSMISGSGRQHLGQSIPKGCWQHSVHDVSNRLQLQQTQNSHSGSFLSLGTSPNSPKYNLSQMNTCMEQKILTEQDFNVHFTSARSLSGSRLKYDFPSPMHAILLHYDKTNSPVLNSGVMKSHQNGSLRARRASFSGPVGRRISRQEFSYKLRKDSSLGELPTSGSYCENDRALSLRRRVRDNDDGVGTFIEMLANRGLSKKRQEERERKQRMLQALAEANKTMMASKCPAKEESPNEDNETAAKKVACDISAASSDISKADSSGVESLQSVDVDSGQWEGSNLSSSGKCGSHISIRSSTSSKASLSSEEGYYSHPGSPQNMHSNNRFSIQSSGSLASSASIAFCQADYSDEDLLESPIDKLPVCPIPESPDSAKTITASSPNCNIVEIIDYQNSPGAKRRSMPPSKSAADNFSNGSTLPPTSTPRNDINSKIYVHKATCDQTSSLEPVQIKITKAKSLPSNAMSSIWKCENIDVSKDALMSPKVSFKNTFDMCLSSGSPTKDDAVSPGSPGTKKDSPSWGKLLPDVPRLSSWRQTSPKGDSPKSSNRSRFDCPRTPTIIEEPKMEAEFSDPPWAPAALSCLSTSPGDNLVMLSPPMCKAPKVPSWRKQNKVSAIVQNENMPQLEDHQAKSAPRVRVQQGEPKPCEEKRGSDATPVRRKSMPQKTNISSHTSNIVVSNAALVKKQQSATHNIAIWQSLSDATVKQKRPVSQTNITIRLAKPENHEHQIRPRCKSHSGSLLPSEKQNCKEHARTKLEGSAMKINVASKAVHEKKGRGGPLPIQTASSSNEHKTKLVQSVEKTPTKVMPAFQPVPGREYLSRTPISDVTNVFQYPTITVKTSSKAQTAKDIQEILKNWVEAKTPTLPPVGTDFGVKTDESCKSTTLPRSFPKSEVKQTFPTADENRDTLRRSKRMFYSQELCAKDGSKMNDTSLQLRMTPLDRNKQFQLNQALCNSNPDVKIGSKQGGSRNSSKPSRDGTDRPQTRTGSQHKGHRSTSPPSPLPESRPRSNTWSRGQEPQHPAGKSSNKHAWIREVVVPPRTPTSRAESSIYEGRSKLRNELSSIEIKQVSRNQLQWFRSCTDLKDTFV